MIFPTVPSRKLQLGLSFLILGGFATYLLYISKDVWLPKIEDNSRFVDSGAAINANIEQEENALPLYVQSGTVEIGNPTDVSTYNMVSYRFGKRMPGERPLMADEGKASGIYVLKDTLLKRVGRIEDLKSGDYVYVAFYETPAWSDSGRKGKTLMGIVDSLERRGREVSFKFLDDPSQADYRLTRDADLTTEDFEGLFDFGDDLFNSIGKGSILRILIDDKNNIRSADVVAPPVNLVSGKVRRIESLGNDQYRLILEDDGNRSFSLDSKSRVVKRGEPDNPRTADDIKRGMEVHLVYYNDLNRYSVLSLDFLEL